MSALDDLKAAVANVNAAADRGALAQVTRDVNGGENGLSARIQLTHLAQNALKSRAVA